MWKDTWDPDDGVLVPKGIKVLLTVLYKDSDRGMSSERNIEKKILIPHGAWGVVE